MTTVTLTTPGLNNWTVPAGVSEILVELFGAQGGAGANSGSPGGEGGTVSFTLQTIPGESFLFPIGATGATASTFGLSTFASNGGYGFGGRGCWGAGGGGSFTGMYSAGGIPVLYALAAGGGGGAPSIVGRDGGAGGPNTGQQGLPLGGPYPTVIPAGGGGGTQSTGGTGGLGDGGYVAFAGTQWSGGDGYDPNDGSGNKGAPGGGAGFYGGGGGGRGNATTNATGAGGGSNHISSAVYGAWANPVTVSNSAGGNTGNGWVRITYGPADHCSLFEATIADVVASDGVTLSVASNSFPDALSNYRISFFDDTTSGTTPSGGLLNAGPWSVGPMTAGQHISYAIRRIDGAHIDGSAVMRATDVPFGLYWDVTVECPRKGAAIQFRRGRRAHVAGLSGVSIQGR